ncbi:MAG TPA: alpha/beta fold hydrolase [Oculatellaceae cyanobacterium]
MSKTEAPDTIPVDLQKLPGLACISHVFEVPLDYSNPAGEKISIFAREIRSKDNAQRSDLPWILFLQGGPGFQSPRPESNDGWLKRALKDYRVLLLDQRGTGLSTPATAQTLLEFEDARAQFEYLKHFRADNIVRDAEFLRERIAAGQRWTLLGQSYGGFCATTYLSQSPAGLQGVVITGGLPPLVDGPDEVYRATYRQLIAKNKLFYERYAEDRVRVARIIEHLCENKTLLPTGEVLTCRRFLQLGLLFGFNLSGHSMNTIHYLLEEAFVSSRRGSGEQLSQTFLTQVERLSGFGTNPIYALLHESIYCQGKASLWSASKVLDEFDEFKSTSETNFFTGEMIYPWMFDDYTQLRPLKETAELLANFESWPKLYDREVLSKNSVPVAAAIYYNDMFVDKAFSEQTAEAIRGCKIWISNEYEHDGLRQDGERILDRLLDMLS